ncbi:hypothetical protein [Pseudonocardia spinosispora]|nr:hypothetical protein [Pseudonocardia spinosispora]
MTPHDGDRGSAHHASGAFHGNAASVALWTASRTRDILRELLAES